MPESVKNGVGSRRAIFLMRQVKCYNLNLSKDMDLWVKAWKDSKKLSAKLEDEVERSIIRGMIDVDFTFEDAHRLFNEGFCKGLGRRAMWLGLYLASNAIECKKEEITSHRHILSKMFETLDPDKNGDPWDDDEAVEEIVNRRLEKNQATRIG
jgi:hypothetical protein